MSSSSVDKRVSDGKAAVILGSYVNAYGIVRELASCGVDALIVCDKSRGLASWSRWVDRFVPYNGTPSGLLRALSALSTEFSRIVVFPTDDAHLEQLLEVLESLPPSVRVPINPRAIQGYGGKTEQLNLARELGIATPRSEVVSSEGDLEALRALRPPFVVKPRDNSRVETRFRPFLAASTAEVLTRTSLRAMSAGTPLVVSEYVVGPEDAIWALTALCLQPGEIHSSWVGQKLSQYPNAFGVFASAVARERADVLAAGEALVRATGAVGIVEPEFKVDVRDGLPYLMEVNLRSMMWHRAGALANVRLHEILWRAWALEDECPQQRQGEGARLVYLKHEIANLLSRRSYASMFVRNVFGGSSRSFAVWDSHDPLPAVKDALSVPKAIAKAVISNWGGAS